MEKSLKRSEENWRVERKIRGYNCLRLSIRKM